MHRIEVRLKSHLPDSRGLGLVKDINDLGITTVSEVRVADIYWLDASLTIDNLDMVCRNILADRVTQDYWCEKITREERNNSTNYYTVEVAYNAGVTDPVEDTVMKALRDLGIEEVKGIKTGKRYLLLGQLDDTQVEIICNRLLVNPIIQHVVKSEYTSFMENPQYNFRLEHIDISDPDRANELRQRFSFSNEELEAIITYFKSLQRDPTDAELETLAQTWSEHCVHKTFKSRINFGRITIDNLLKSTIVKVTEELKQPWCLSVFEDNAGVIDFDGTWALCFKVETHNHPSAVEPYGGAATGIGGVVRDPLGTGLGAKPILNTDVFCFAPPDYSYEKLPKGVLHPRRIFKGVRAGVADYGNRLGIPTLNGAILFDERYVANPLVFCGTLGILPCTLAQRGQHQPNDLVVLIGGKTGRDGIHGKNQVRILIARSRLAILSLRRS
jgi:phosphoribosylformylglycinamidine synthase